MFLAHKLYIVLIYLIATKKNVDFPRIYDKSKKNTKKRLK